MLNGNHIRPGLSTSAVVKEGVFFTALCPTIFHDIGFPNVNSIKCILKQSKRG